MIKLLLAGLLLAAASGVPAATTIFTWDASPGPTVTGYELGCGPAIGNYGTPIDVKKVLTWTLTTLPEGVASFCNVRAYDAAGVRSAWNGEVTVTPPRTPPPPPTNLRVQVVVSVTVNGVKVADVATDTDVPAQ